jgi:hypothetical protein
MPALNAFDALYVFTAFVFHLALFIHFALRRWRFAWAVRHGWWVYALSLPAAAVSAALLAERRPWAFALAGLLYLAWAAFGFWVEYVRPTQWRAPIRWPIFAPYLTLYLATTMFYWWPLVGLWKPLWYAAMALFVVNLYLNVTSHHAGDTPGRASP